MQSFNKKNKSKKLTIIIPTTGEISVELFVSLLSQTAMAAKQVVLNFIVDGPSTLPSRHFPRLHEQMHQLAEYGYEVQHIYLPFNTKAAYVADPGGAPTVVGYALAYTDWAGSMGNDNAYKPMFLREALKAIDAADGCNLIQWDRDFYSKISKKRICRDDFEALGSRSGIAAAAGGLFDGNCYIAHRAISWIFMGAIAYPVEYGGDRQVTNMINSGIDGGLIKVKRLSRSLVNYYMQPTLETNERFWEMRNEYKKRIKG